MKKPEVENLVKLELQLAKILQLFKCVFDPSIERFQINPRYSYFNFLGGSPRYAHRCFPCSTAFLPRFAKFRGTYLSAEFGK
jgi:hypothetical protein